jgi:hypothetical protein
MNIENINQIGTNNKLKSNIVSADLILEKPKEEQTKQNLKELSELIADRKILPTKDVLSDIIANTDENNLKEVAALLLSNEKIIENSTVARGDSFDGKGTNQAILRGSIEEPLVQVVITKGSNEPTNFLKGEYEFVPFEESDRNDYNRTVLHELLHSFTRYIGAAHDMQKEELLTKPEREFYQNVSTLHQEFLKEHSTNDKYLDKLDEYIVKSLTSNLADNGWFDEKQYNQMYKEFKKLYEQNTRPIQSISTKLSSHSNNERE